jgi:hypothetical protein
MGLYIRGIYGGEVKKGEKKYAGLVLEEYRQDSVKLEFKLHGARDMLVVPVDLLRKYGVKIYKMIYMGEINPFKLRKYLNTILSQQSENCLKQFLREALKLNLRNISKDAFSKVEGLINELKQPSNIRTLNMNKHYVIYRRIRAFTASAFKPIADNFIIKDEVGYVECRDEPTAYYYVAVLNYLAFKVIEYKRTFIRTQYARPLFAISRIVEDVDYETKKKVIELSKKLHEKAPHEEYSNQKVALRNIALSPEFKELVKILDSKISKEKLEEALNMVSAIGLEKE